MLTGRDAESGQRDPEDDSARQRQRIALFAINYSPEPTGIGPYVTELAEHLAAKGHEVSVVTSFPHYPWWKRQDDYRGKRSSTEMINGVRVERRWCWIPGRPTLFRRLLFELSFLVSALPVALVMKADVYVGYSPAMSSAILAMLAAKRRSGRFVMVLQDLAGRGIRQSGLTSLRLLSDSLGHVEMATARRARPAIAITDSFIDPLVEGGVKRDNIVVLPNWAKSDMPKPTDIAIEEMRSRLAPDGETLAVHAGSMGKKQALWQVVDAAKLAEASDEAIRFVLVGDGGERASLEKLAEGLSNMQFVDPLPDVEFSAVLHAADVLLLCQDPNNTDMSFPSKLTSYAAARRPIVAMVSPTGSVASFLGAAQASAIGQTPQDLVDQVLQFSSTADRPLRGEYLNSSENEASLVGWSDQILDDNAQRRAGCV